MLDELDHQILHALQKNARIPVKEIARQVSLTGPAVSSRIRKMEQDGVISGYTTILHEPEASTQVDALISVSVEPGARDTFLDDLAEIPSVQQCFHVTGSHSYIAKVRCQNMDSLEHLITRLQRTGPTSTQIILSTPLDRTRGPI